MEPNNNIQLGVGAIYMDGVDIGVGKLEATQYTEDPCTDEDFTPFRLNDPAEFEGTISIPPEACIRIFGLWWYIKFKIQRLCEKIKKEKNHDKP